MADAHAACKSRLDNTIARLKLSGDDQIVNEIRDLLRNRCLLAAAIGELAEP
jgi:hypothetical protein